ncbi:MAG: DUF4252 domain-containing protein [Alloprevotella sp.]
MKRTLALLFSLTCTLCLWAQKQQDFAARFMQLHGKEIAMECTTISPLMMERMLQLPSLENDDANRDALKQVKTIRLVINKDKHETDRAFDQAVELATQNAARYVLQAENTNRKIYTRRRGTNIVEIVLLTKQNGGFTLVDLTGNMTEAFIQSLMHH